MLLGVDLGGTKTEIIALEPESGQEILRHRVASPRDDYQATLDTIVKLVSHAKSETGKAVSSVGIGIPGTISKDTGCVKNANSTWLNGNPLAKDLSELLALPVAVDNDANCFAVSEATDGGAAGKEVVFGVIIGTGCGAGLSVNGKAHIGINGIGGEWGHNPLPWPRLFSPDAAALEKANGQARDNIISPIYAEKPQQAFYVANEHDNEFPGKACYCGKFGCLETWISGTAFEQDYLLRSGEQLKGPEIVAASENGNPNAKRTIEIYTDRLARGLAHVIDIVDPDAIVLGGGMGNIDSLYSDLPELLEQYCFTDTLKVDIARPKFGDSSGVRGAAWLGRSAA